MESRDFVDNRNNSKLQGLNSKIRETVLDNVLWYVSFGIKIKL